MSYTIDEDLKQGMRLLEEGKRVPEGLKLVNRSARQGTTKGKSYFEIAQIIREGDYNIPADSEEARHYYDVAMEHFNNTSCDGMDHRMMGDYYYYGLGSEKADVNKALGYYNLAASEGDDVSRERAIEIRVGQANGTIEAPELTPETKLKEVAQAEEDAKKAIAEANAANQAATGQIPVSTTTSQTSTGAPIYITNIYAGPSYGNTAPVVPQAESKPAAQPEELPPVENPSEKPAPALIPSPTPVVSPLTNESTPVTAPVVVSEAEQVEEEELDPTIKEVVDSEQLTIKAIRLIDSRSSTKQDKLDGIEMLKAASEQGSSRAATLLGFLYEGDNKLVKRDYELAKKYYDRAIDLGSAAALFRLGILLTDRDFTFFDINKGHEYILESAHRGYAWALLYIGDCFRAKVSDRRNLDLAYRYYALAGERGIGLGYHNMSEIDASRQQLTLAKEHESLAFENGYDPALGYQDPLFYSLHI